MVHMWAASWQNHQNGMCAHRRLRSARVFAVRMQKAWVLSYPLSTQPRRWSDWADAQADLSLHWAHRSFCWFCHAAANVIIYRKSIHQKLLELYVEESGRQEDDKVKKMSIVNMLDGQIPNCYLKGQEHTDINEVCLKVFLKTAHFDANCMKIGFLFLKILWFYVFKTTFWNKH